VIARGPRTPARTHPRYDRIMLLAQMAEPERERECREIYHKSIYGLKLYAMCDITSHAHS